MTFTERLADFFHLGDFAVTATIGGTAVVGHYDDAYADFEDIEGTGPAFIARAATLPDGVSDGDSVTIGTQAFVVRSLEPDGSGVVVLRLEKTA